MIYKSVIALVTLLIFMVSSSLVLPGCSLLSSVQEHTIDAKADVKVTDPTIRRLTGITREIKIDAKGRFKKGTFLVNNIPITIPPDTGFHLEVTVPIDNPDVISTKNAVGRLKTTNQLSVASVPVPQELEIKKGKVTGRFDLGRTMSAFFFNLLQVGAVSGEMHSMLESIELENVYMDLRPGSKLIIGEKSLSIGDGSKVHLKDAVVNYDLTFTGNCEVDINFGKNCRWVGSKVDCLFDGGHAKFLLKAEKLKDRLKLSRNGEKNYEPLLLENCVFNFGKNKRCHSKSAKGLITPSEFWWQQVKEAPHPLMHLVAAMDMVGTHLTLKTDIHQTDAYFPGTIPARLTVDIKENDRPTHFDTSGPALAEDATITIKKKNTSIKLSLRQVTVKNVDYNRLDDLKFSLAGGTSSLKSLEWSGQNSNFDLECGAGSKLTVPDEMLIVKAKGDEKTQLKLPIVLDLSSARLRSKSSTIPVKNLSGDIVVSVGPEVHVSSDMSFELGSPTLLGDQSAKIDAKGLELSIRNGQPGIYLQDCTLIVPDKALEKALRKKIPDHFELTLNKTIRKSKKWRYSNAIADTAKITDFKLENLVADQPDTLSFEATAMVRVDGTVDKSGIVFNRNKEETKPWNVEGMVRGKGKIKYTVEAKKKGPARLTYKLNMNVTVPDDVKLDWSKVASGVLKMAERKIIVGHIKEVEIPIEKSGDLEIFDRKSQISELRISKMTMKETPRGRLIKFTAAVH